MKARGAVPLMILAAGVMVVGLMASSPTPAAAWCPPSTRPANPAPVTQAPSAVSDCLARVLDAFRLHEESTQTVRLEKGRSYWVSANGCPRMGNIGLAIRDGNGNIFKQSVGYKPSFCFVPPDSGEYRLIVRANSLIGSNASGNIDACMSASRCGDPIAR